MKSSKYHIDASDKVVWIHNQNGQCVGRFGKYSSEILSKHGYTVRVSYPVWETWKKDAEEEFGIEIPEEMKPNV
ncbi:MAG: hypothetical protein GWN86_21055 [Desulfobacterales bacterium]|nr:hypothetical protein [Desulfobacterales bacterium]